MRQTFIARSDLFTYDGSAGDYNLTFSAPNRYFIPLITDPAAPTPYLPKDSLAQVTAVRFGVVGISGARMAISGQLAQANAAIAAIDRIGNQVSVIYETSVSNVDQWQTWEQVINRADFNEDYRIALVQPNPRVRIDQLNIQPVYIPRPACYLTIELDVRFAGLVVI